MRALTQLVPLGVALVAFMLTVTFLLPRNANLAAWLIAAFVLAHGLVHAMFVAPRAVTSTPGAQFAFDPNHSWLVTTGTLDARVVKAVVVALVVATLAGYTLAAGAAAHVIVPAEWWSPLVLGATFASGLLMGVALMPGLVLGIAIDVGLAWLAVTGAWSPVAS
jgi:hypothetical protein